MDTLKSKIKIYERIEKHYEAFKASIQSELRNIANLKALDKAISLWKNYRRSRNLHVSPTGEDHKTVYEYYSKRRSAQEDCFHLKGGNRSPRSIMKDYAVYKYTFIDGSQRIKCFLCSREWWFTTKHIDADWDIAMKMVQESTNTPSSSEVPLDQIKKDIPNGPDNLLQRIT